MVKFNNCSYEILRKGCAAMNFIIFMKVAVRIYSEEELKSSAARCKSSLRILLYFTTTVYCTLAEIVD